MARLWHMNLIPYREYFNSHRYFNFTAMPTTISKTKKTPAAKSSRNTNTTTTSGSRSSSREMGGHDNSLLEKFLLDSLKDIYWAEKHLTKALPKMKKAATSEDLQNAFDEHLSVTENHIKRLEEVFDMLGKKAQAKKCEAMDGLVKEAGDITEETEKGTSTRDVGLIMAAQKVEHYEIATYGGLVQLTKILGLSDASDLLAQTLSEEKEADQTLTSIAENHVNMDAEQEGDEAGKNK